MASAISGLGDSNFSQASADRLSHLKVLHEKSFTVSQTGTVVAGTYYIHTARGSGTIRKFSAAITETIATGADRTVTADLQYGNTATGFTSLLSAVITLNNGTTLRAVNDGTISISAVSASDLLRVVIAVAGSAGNQALGLCVTCTLSENPTS